GVPASACLRIAMIWLSLNFDVFMQNLLRLSYEKILLFKEVIYRDDYRGLYRLVDKCHQQ
ncbi:MAG: hypothetical protein Q7U16_20395, partial [Agitococcus sp.]|nr:hypothetical protein [Agitococcus sp.]